MLEGQLKARGAREAVPIHELIKISQLAYDHLNHEGTDSDSQGTFEHRTALIN